MTKVRIHVDYQQASLSAASMRRNLSGRRSGWGQLIANAQAVLAAFSNSDYAREGDHKELYEEAVATPLIAAARTLDAAAEILLDEELSEHARSRLRILSALAYSMYGNFPSASAVLGKFREEEFSLSPAILLALSIASPRTLPTRLAKLRNHAIYAEPAEALNSFLNGSKEYSGQMVRSLFKTALASTEDTFDVVVMRLARLSLRHAITLSTAKTLGSLTGSLPVHFVQTLLRSDLKTLLPPQYVLLKHGRLLNSSDNSLLALPTSTGKTLLGELCLARAMGTEPGLCIYVAPYVALGRQVENAIRKHFPKSVRVHGLFGTFRTQDSLDPNLHQEIVVATPERLDGLLRGTPNLFRALRCIVVDEAHLVEGHSRGLKLEGILGRVNLAQKRGVSCRLVLLSAVLARYDALTEWLGILPEHVYTSKWRPTARRLAFWSQDGKLIWVHGSDPLKPLEASETTELGHQIKLWPDPEISDTSHEGVVRAQQKKVNSNIAYLAEALHLEFGGTVLCVCSTKAQSRAIARELSRRTGKLDPLPPKLEEAVRLVDQAPPHFSWLRGLLERGIAFHNAGLPQSLRAAIEDAVSAREMKAVAATTTLAEGVDLPFRSTIIVNWLLGFGTNQKPMSPLMFRNIAGRCGRAGVFTEGDTIIYDNPLRTNVPSSSARWRMISKSVLGAPEPLASALRLVPDVLSREVAESVLASQLLAAIPENPKSEHVEMDLAEHLLAAREPELKIPAINMLKQARRTLLEGGDLALARAASPMKLTDFGKAANLSGFGPVSCRSLLEILGNLPESASDSQCAAIILIKTAAFPEQTYENLRKVTTSSRSTFLVKPRDFEPLLRSWLSGSTRTAMFVELPYVQRSSKSPKADVWVKGNVEAEGWEGEFDKFEEFLAQIIQGYLPWVLRACERLKIFANQAPPWVSEFDWESLAVSLEEQPRDDGTGDENAEV